MSATEPSPGSRAFPDHFSGHAEEYSRFRPTYPSALFDWIAGLVPSAARVWDCATGNGQAALALAQRFPEVIATDASAEQLASATPHPRVRYEQRPASDSGLADQAVGLVTVAQALHWFEPEPFHRELRRVLAPGGVVVAWCYELFSVDDAFDEPMLELYRDVLGEDWPPQRRHIETGYREIEWPFERMQVPTFEMVSEWDLDQTLGYLRTWSALRRWQAREGRDPLALVEPRLRQGWGDAGQRPVRWPLRLLASRI